jgi:hypothetical protein
MSLLDTDRDVTLNYSNSATTSNAKFVMDLGTNPILLANHEVALSHFQFYNFVPNISTALGNTSIKYVDWNGADKTVDLLQGLQTTSGQLSIDDMNNILHTQMRKDHQYLLDSNGNPVYFLSLAADLNYNKVYVQWDAVPKETDLGTLNYKYYDGSTHIASAPDALPGVYKYLQLKIESTPIQTNLGINTGLYPINQTAGNTLAAALNTSESILGQNIPQISTVTGLTIRCNLSGPSRLPPFDSNLLALIPLSADTLQYQSYEPFNLSWKRIPLKAFNTIEITICDQDGTPLTQLVENFGTSFTLQFRARDLDSAINPDASKRVRVL